MSAFNDNDQSKKCHRFVDLSDEPLIMMTPIKGYEKMPLVSLEEAIQPLIPSMSAIEQMAYITKQRCLKSTSSHLSVDQSAAIMLYTMEWAPKEESVYFILNKCLRNEDRQSLTPWFLYLKLFFSALSLLPSSSRTVYRGVKHDLKHKYKKGEKIVWWGFSSCTRTMDVLSNEAFMGPSGNRTLFAIECQSGKDIQEYSYFKKESEVLLPAAREFQVESVFPQAGGLTMIQLKETEPKYPLLESNFTISKIVQKFAPPQSNQVTPQQSSPPVYTQPNQMTQSKLKILSYFFSFTIIIIQNYYLIMKFFYLDQPYDIQSNHSSERDSPAPVYISKSRFSHGCGYYCLICCGLVFCCPCTLCYLYCKH
jgi:hypothetical protein